MPDLMITIQEAEADRLAETFGTDHAGVVPIVLDMLAGETLPRFYLSDEDRDALEAALAASVGEAVRGAQSRTRAAGLRALRRLRRMGT